MTDYMYKILNSNSKIYIFISNIDFECNISFMIKEITKKKKLLLTLLGNITPTKSYLLRNHFFKCKT